MRPPRGKSGIEVGDRGDLFAIGPGFLEDQAVALEAEPFETPRDDVERPFVLRRDARPADQLGGEIDRVDRPVATGREGLAHSRSNSLIAVLARVCASTCLTMTAQ